MLNNEEDEVELQDASPLSSPSGSPPPLLARTTSHQELGGRTTAPFSPVDPLGTPAQAISSVAAMDQGAVRAVQSVATTASASRPYVPHVSPYQHPLVPMTRRDGEPQTLSRAILPRPPANRPSLGGDLPVLSPSSSSGQIKVVLPASELQYAREILQTRETVSAAVRDLPLKPMRILVPPEGLSASGSRVSPTVKQDPLDTDFRSSSSDRCDESPTHITRSRMWQEDAGMFRRSRPAEKRSREMPCAEDIMKGCWTGTAPNERDHPHPSPRKRPYNDAITMASCSTESALGTASRTVVMMKKAAATSRPEHLSVYMPRNHGNGNSRHTGTGREDHGYGGGGPGMRYRDESNAWRWTASETVLLLDILEEHLKSSAATGHRQQGIWRDLSKRFACRRGLAPLSGPSATQLQTKWKNLVASEKRSRRRDKLPPGAAPQPTRTGPKCLLDETQQRRLSGLVRLSSELSDSQRSSVSAYNKNGDPGLETPTPASTQQQKRLSGQVRQVSSYLSDSQRSSSGGSSSSSTACSKTDDPGLETPTPTSSTRSPRVPRASPEACSGLAVDTGRKAVTPAVAWTALQTLQPAGSEEQQAGSIRGPNVCHNGTQSPFVSSEDSNDVLRSPTATGTNYEENGLAGSSPTSSLEVSGADRQSPKNPSDLSPIISKNDSEPSVDGLACRSSANVYASCSHSATASGAFAVYTRSPQSGCDHRSVAGMVNSGPCSVGLISAAAGIGANALSPGDVAAMRKSTQTQEPDYSRAAPCPHCHRQTPPDSHGQSPGEAHRSSPAEACGKFPTAAMNECSGGTVRRTSARATDSESILGARQCQELTGALLDIRDLLRGIATSIGTLVEHSHTALG